MSSQLSLIGSFLQRTSILLGQSLSDLVDFLLNVILEDQYGFPIFTIESELAAAGILMHGNYWSPLGGDHGLIVLLHDMQVHRLHPMWIPLIERIDDEFWMNTFEQIVTLVNLIDVGLDIGGFLEEEASIQRIGTINDWT